DRRSLARLGISEAATACFDDAHTLPGRQLVAALGVHRLAIDRVHPERPVSATEHSTRRKHGTITHAEGGDEMPAVVAQDHLLAKTSPPLSRTAGVRQQPFALDGGVRQRLPY